MAIFCRSNFTPHINQFSETNSSQGGPRESREELEREPNAARERERKIARAGLGRAALREI